MIQKKETIVRDELRRRENPRMFPDLLLQAMMARTAEAVRKSKQQLDDTHRFTSALFQDRSMTPFGRTLHHAGPGKYACSVCNEPVALESAKTDDDGQLVHEECYLAKFSGLIAPKPIRGSSRSFENWKRLLRKDCVVQEKERAFDGLGDYVLRLLHESGLDPTVEAIVKNGVNGHVNAGKKDYEKLVDEAVALMRSDYASVQMLYPERGSGGELRLLAFRGFNPEAAKFWEWVRADSKSTCGLALRDKTRVVAPDIASCDFMAGSDDQQVYLQTGIHACQTTPLIGAAGSVVGMISTHWRTPHQPSDKEFESFDALAKEAADLIQTSPR